MMTELENIDIRELIPQREPMIMVDALTGFDPVVTTTRFEVRPDNIFVDSGRLSPEGIIENIAQTCAARMGYINKYLKAEAVKLGFIGAMKGFSVEYMPGVGDRLDTTIEVADEVFSITLVRARVEAGGRLVAQGEMKISLTGINSKSDE